MATPAVAPSCAAAASFAPCECKHFWDKCICHHALAIASVVGDLNLLKPVTDMPGKKPRGRPRKGEGKALEEKDLRHLPVQRRGPEGNKQRFYNIADVTPALFVGWTVLDIRELPSVRTGRLAHPKESYVLGKITCYTPADDTDKKVSEPLWRIEFDKYEPQDWTQDEVATGLELSDRIRGSIVS